MASNTVIFSSLIQMWQIFLNFINFQNNFSCPIAKHQVIQRNNAVGLEEASVQSVEETILVEESFPKLENSKSTPLCAATNPFTDYQLESEENKNSTQNQDDSFASLELNYSSTNQKINSIRKSSRLISKKN